MGWRGGSNGSVCIGVGLVEVSKACAFAVRPHSTAPFLTSVNLGLLICIRVHIELPLGLHTLHCQVQNANVGLLI